MKLDKKSVDYTDKAMVKTERCALCKYFEQPACQIVAGMIAEEGWCLRFARGKAK